MVHRHDDETMRSQMLDEVGETRTKPGMGMAVYHQRIGAAGHICVCLHKGVPVDLPRGRLAGFEGHHIGDSGFGSGPD